MTTAILIGFHYPLIKTIPGTIMDLYHAYRFCRLCGYKIHILTDMRNISYTDTMNRAVRHNVVDSGIRRFMTDVSQYNLIYHKEDLIKTIKDIELGEDEKLFVYYSGHGVPDAIVLPNQERYSILEFRDLVLSICQDNTDIFWIMDCCNPNGMYLPFKLNNKRFRLSASEDDIKSMISAVSNKILLITSSSEEQKSVATAFGSLFTRFLFDTLGNLTVRDDKPGIYPKLAGRPRNRNLVTIIRFIEYKVKAVAQEYPQTVNVYTTQISPTVLWSWIGTHDTDITIDYELNALTVS